MRPSLAFATLVFSSVVFAAPLPAEEVKVADTDILYTPNNWVIKPPGQQRNEAASTDVNQASTEIRAVAEREITAPDTDQLEVCPYWCPNNNNKK